MEAVQPGALASRSVPLELPDISEVSPFSGRKYLDGPGVSDDTESAEDLRHRPRPCGLPLKPSPVGTPRAAFRSSIAQPAEAPLHAAAVTSRHPLLDLGSG
jgi:hypothetical protein